MPLVLILLEQQEPNHNNVIEISRYQNIDSRLIQIKKYSENLVFIDETICEILLRFCSIHNELGDIIEIEGKENIDLVKRYFPFNINLACIGRSGSGKSAGVNALLKEYKSKEGCKGGSQTKSHKFYQVQNQPIRILDIPGFENKETVEDSIKTFKESRKEINRLKEKIHIILYFLNFGDERHFMEFEYLMLDEILDNKSSKIIYVITHSNPDLTGEMKNIIKEKINSGIAEFIKNKKEDKNSKKENRKEDKDFKKKEKNINSIFLANDNNVVFVNFHKDKLHNYAPFGVEDLFKKVGDFFKESDEYKNSRNFNEETIETRALQLRENAYNVLKKNTILASLIGFIPIFDIALNEYMIKNKAAYSIGEIFGVNVKFINESKIEKKNNNKNINVVSQFSNNNKNINVVSQASKNAMFFGGGGFCLGQIVIKGVSRFLKIGIGASGLGAIIGALANGYLTYKFCEKLIDSFVDYYKNNAEDLQNSYELAIEYLYENGSNNSDNNNNCDNTNDELNNIGINENNNCDNINDELNNIGINENNPYNRYDEINNIGINNINNNIGINNMNNMYNNFMDNNMEINNMNNMYNNFMYNNMGINNMHNIYNNFMNMNRNNRNNFMNNNIMGINNMNNFMNNNIMGINNMNMNNYLYNNIIGRNNMNTNNFMNNMGMFHMNFNNNMGINTMNMNI